jgi:hypothetical protein
MYFMPHLSWEARFSALLVSFQGRKAQSSLPCLTSLYTDSPTHPCSTGPLSLAPAHSRGTCVALYKVLCHKNYFYFSN